MSPRISTLHRASSPAKVNLYLKVTGRRPDGYHELSTLMARLELTDELELTFTCGEDQLQAVGLNLPRPLPPDFNGASNLALRAVRGYRQKTGWPQDGVKLFLEKNIPLGAGLGGGSSNGATVLKLLNQLAPNPLAETELDALGLSLGADVPFFLQPRSPALATGVGEILSTPPQAKALKDWTGQPLGLVNSGICLSTALVFKTLGLTNEPPNYNLDPLPDLGEGRNGLPNDTPDFGENGFPTHTPDLRKNGFPTHTPDLGENDLLIPALKLEPCLAQVVTMIQAARPQYWGLTGSGATFWYYAPKSTPEFPAGWWCRETKLC